MVLRGVQLSGHFPAKAVKAFRMLTATNNMDVQELLAEAINMVFNATARPSASRPPAAGTSGPDPRPVRKP